MKSWVLSRLEEVGTAYPNDREYTLFVVRAETQQGARALAAANDQRFWDVKFASCEELMVEGEPGIISAESYYS